MHAFRDYDPTSGLWQGPEPLSDLFPEWSSYSAMGNIPVNNIDPLGLDWYTNNETGKTHWQEGSDELEGHKNIGANYTIYGENQMIVHHQNEVEQVVDYADLAPKDSYTGINDPQNVDVFEFANSFPTLMGSSLMAATILLDGNASAFNHTSKYYARNFARVSGGLSAISTAASGVSYFQYLNNGGDLNSMETLFFSADLFFGVIGSRSWQGTIAAGAWELGKQLGGYKNYLELKNSPGGIDGLRTTRR